MCLPFPPEPGDPVVLEDEGAEYGVNIMDTFTKPGIQIDAATIYWNLSTWNPYRVVQMRTQLSSQSFVSP
jgi:hypothetical protein